MHHWFDATLYCGLLMLSDEPNCPRVLLVKKKKMDVLSFIISLCNKFLKTAQHSLGKQKGKAHLQEQQLCVLWMMDGVSQQAE
jgi:hypothetical protein